jgi:L-aspartate oxidase
VAAPPHVLREAMSRLAALERDEQGLREALAVIARLQHGQSEPALLNMLASARLVAAAALARCESRGAHWRTDYPVSDAEARRTFLTLAEAEQISEAEAAPSERRARP